MTTRTRPRADATRGDADAAAAGWLCVGVIGKPKGVRGAFRVTTYTARPEDVTAYGPPRDGPDGRELALEVAETAKGGVVARLPGVADRDAAEALRGTRLYLPRAALPEADAGEYYHADLVGLAVELTGGAAFGTVRAVHDFGAGDLLEVAPAAGGETVLVPFTSEAVPEVDLVGGRLVIAPLGDDAADEESAG